MGSTAGSYGYVDFEVVSPSSTATNLPRFDMQIGNTNEKYTIPGIRESVQYVTNKNDK